MKGTLIRIRSFAELLGKGSITPKKMLNFAKVRASLLLKMPKVWGMPYSFTIEPTNYCNLKCPLCPAGTGKLGRERGFMDFELYKKVIDEAGLYMFNVLLTTWGEPFLHKEVYRMIGYAKRKRIRTVIMTNGHFFNEDNAKKLLDAGLDRLIIDLDGADQETLVKYRKNADFNRIVEGIKSVVAEKRRMKTNEPEIELQFVVMKHNEHQLGRIKELSRQLGVDALVLKSAWVNNEEEAKKYVPNNKKFSRYVWGIKRDRKVKNGCGYLWTGGLVYWNGDVCACCVDYSGKIVFGNVKNETFRKIWNSKKFSAFRKRVLRKKAVIPICANCLGGDENFDVERIRFKHANYKEMR